METIIYLITNSKELPTNATSEYSVSNESLDERAQKIVLGIKGEDKAKKFSQNHIFDNVSIIYSSDFASSIATAKYLAKRHEIPIRIDERLRERKFGNLDPKNIKMFIYTEEHNFDYKINNGESIFDAKKRFINIFNEILDMNLGKEIAIFSHETIITAFLLDFCEAKYNLDDKLILTYKEENFSKLDAPDGFKLYINNKTIVNIEKI